MCIAKAFSQFLLIRLLIETITPVSAQNLVPNPSFESNVQCPTGLSEISSCQNWFTPNWGTPDYFHTCNGGTVGIPINVWGGQIADTGSAYAGIGTNVRGDVREYLCVQLTDTLLAQEQYCISFFVSLAENSYAASNSIGAMFLADTATVPNASAYFISSDVTDSLIVDSMGWQEISFLYNATGNERFLLLGVLQPDSLLAIQWLTSDTMSSSLAYYYVENVSVRKCDTSIPEPIFTEYSLYPNPSNGAFNISGNFPAATELSIYNMLGQKIGESIILPEGNRIISVDLELAQGTYYYELRTPAERVAEGKFIIIE